MAFMNSFTSLKIAIMNNYTIISILDFNNYNHILPDDTINKSDRKAIESFLSNYKYVPIYNKLYLGTYTTTLKIMVSEDKIFIIRIFKKKDEWFFVEYSLIRNTPYYKNGKIIKYKCDQIDGLIEVIKLILNELNE